MIFNTEVKRLFLVVLSVAQNYGTIIQIESLSEVLLNLDLRP